jgi:hypothetical protein
MSYIVQIIPVEIPQSPIIETAVRIVVLSVNLNVSANIDAQILDSNNIIVDVKHLILEQPDYSNWGTDDQFVVNWTLQQLGLNPKQ